MNDLQFKPLSKGLGIDKKSNFHSSLKQKPLHKKLKEEQTVVNEFVADAAIDLGSIFGATPVVTKESNVQSHANMIEVSHTKAFLAWGIDVLNILSLVFLSLLPMLSIVRHNATPYTLEFSVLGVLLFCFYYIIYFTLLESTSTMGGLIMNIRIRKENGQKISAMDAMKRALISLFSILAFAGPNLFAFHSRLTHTKATKVN